jgi:hypothetical protein
MTDSFDYDGAGRLGEAIAALYGFSPKNQPRIAEKIKEAKAALNIVSDAKVLPNSDRLKVYRWHYDRLHPAANESVETISHTEASDNVEIFSQPNQDDSVKIDSQPEPITLNESVELYSQANSQPVEIISQDVQGNAVETISQSKANDTVEINSHYEMNDVVRIAFYTVKHGMKTRQVIALDGFYVNALMLAAGIPKQDVPKWVQAAVNGWAAFDSALPITRQVKYLLIRELTDAIRR